MLGHGVTSGAAFRGQPLLVLGVLLAGWLGARATLWQTPLEVPLGPEWSVAATAADRPATGVGDRLMALAGLRGLRRESTGEAADRTRLARLVIAGSAALPSPILLPALQGVPQTASVPVRLAVGHNLLFAAGLAQMDVPPALRAHFVGGMAGIPAAAPAFARAPSPRPSDRWSADAWLLLRGDGGIEPVAAGRPSYGRSQAGAVVRYSLAPGSRHRPQAYVRASSALGGAREQDIAAGLSARPGSRWPVRVAVEARMSRTEPGVDLRPAAFAVTELPALELPLGMRGEAYLQGGYVGGRFATAFIDGQARIERPLARWQDGELSGGAGVWGGAQKGSARLDVGPTAAVSFRLGDSRGRIAADYRFRVAGEAQPASGPALTLSAGF